MLEREPVHPRSLNPTADRDLATICLKCLQKDPLRRYESAATLADDLERWLGGEPIKARPSTVWERMGKWVRRRPAAAALVAVSSLATLTLLVVVGVFVWQLRAALDEVERREQQTDEQRQRAEDQAQLALQRERLARGYWYGADLNLAEQALQAGDSPRFHSLLERQRSQPGWEDVHSFEWDYLWRQGHAEKAILPIPVEPSGGDLLSDQFALAYAPDGKALAVASSQGIQFWDLAAGRKRWTLKGLPFVGILAFSPDGKTLAVGCWNLNFGAKDVPPQVHLVDAATGRERFALNELQGRVQALAFFPDGKTLAVAQEDYNFVASGQMIKSTTALETLAGVTPVPTNLRIWNLESRRGTTVPLKVKGFQLGAGGTAAAFAPDGKTLAVGGGGIPFDPSAMWRSPPKLGGILGKAEGVVCLWDVGTGSARNLLKAPGRNPSLSVSALAFAPHGRVLAVGYLDGSITLWDQHGGKELVTLTGHRLGLMALAFAPDGKTLASAGKDGAVRLWDAATGNALATFLGHDSAAACVAFAPDGKALASASFDGTVRLWDPAARPGPTLLASDSGNLFGPPFALAPDGKTLIAARNNGVSFWDLAGGTERGSLKPAQAVNPRRRGGGNRVIDDLVLSPGGKRLAVRRGFEVEVWDLTSERELSGFRLKRSSSTHLIFAAGGRILIAGGKLWDAATGKEARQAFPAALADAAALSPDGKLLVTAGKFRQGARPMTVRDAASGAELYTLTALDSFVAFSADNRTMAAPLVDGGVGLWDVATGRQQTVLRGHAYGVAAAAFSPDGRTIATSGSDRSVRLWDPATGQERLSLRLEDRRPRGLAFSTGGKILVVSWGGPPGNPLGLGVLALYRAARDGQPPLWQSE